MDVSFTCGATANQSEITQAEYNPSHASARMDQFLRPCFSLP